MKCVFLFYLGFLSIIIAKIVVIAFKNCTDSPPTILHVPRCPESQEQWTNAAARKNCSKFNHTCDSFEYHCVMNAWRDETIEVCAPSLLIVGNFCAEYNYKGERIQRNRKANCSECPESYISTKSFKYQECYRPIKEINLSTERQPTTDFNPGPTTREKTMPVSDAPSKREHIDSDHSQGSNANIIVICVLCTVVGVGVLLAILALYKIPCKLRRRFTSNHPKELPVNGNDSANETFLANGNPNLQI